ncbi:hypothetical protein ACFWB2_12775 [Streptomyces virginiae]|uniref:hypothetical protein n=1 Tax=Streptomyces virginiae TaxID=1961 RepID=UPI0036CC83B1
MTATAQGVLGRSTSSFMGGRAGQRGREPPSYAQRLFDARKAGTSDQEMSQIIAEGLKEIYSRTAGLAADVLRDVVVPALLAHPAYRTATAEGDTLTIHLATGRYYTPALSPAA